MHARSRYFAAIATALTLTLGSTALLAQGRGDQGRGRQSGRQGEQRQVQPPPSRGAQARPAPQNERPRQPETRPAPEAYREPQGRPQGRPDVRQQPNRGGQVQPRAIPRTVPRYDTRNWTRPPTFVLPRYSSRFNQPYYSFRPRLQLSFGLIVGHPFAYPNWYDPFGRDSWFYGSRWSSYRSYYGGITFDIRPLDTAIFVDGDYVGRAGDFGPFNAPLTLYSGRHRIELEARGCAPAVFDVHVFAREVIPYRGSLRCY